MRVALTDLNLAHLFIVTPGGLSYPLDETISVLTVTDLDTVLKDGRISIDLKRADTRQRASQVSGVRNGSPELAKGRIRGFPSFACTASFVRSGATPCRSEAPHTWLSPATLDLYSSTASLRHVHGSPVLGLLRRLCPPHETSPDLAACPASRTGRSCRGSRVH
jgi:hypothetical protein